MKIDTSIVIVPDISCGDILEVKGFKYTRSTDVFLVISTNIKRDIRKHLDNGIVYSLVVANDYPRKNLPDYDGDAFIRFDLIKRIWRGYSGDSFSDKIKVKRLAAGESDEV